MVLYEFMTEGLSSVSNNIAAVRWWLHSWCCSARLQRLCCFTFKIFTVSKIFIWCKLFAPYKYFWNCISLMQAFTSKGISLSNIGAFYFVKIPTFMHLITNQNASSWKGHILSSSSSRPTSSSVQSNVKFIHQLEARIQKHVSQLLQMLANKCAELGLLTNIVDLTQSSWARQSSMLLYDHCMCFATVGCCWFLRGCVCLCVFCLWREIHAAWFDKSAILPPWSCQTPGFHSTCPFPCGSVCLMSPSLTLTFLLLTLFRFPLCFFSLCHPAQCCTPPL